MSKAPGKPTDPSLHFTKFTPGEKYFVRQLIINPNKEVCVQISIFFRFVIFRSGHVGCLLQCVYGGDFLGCCLVNWHTLTVIFVHTYGLNEYRNR